MGSEEPMGACSGGPRVSRIARLCLCAVALAVCGCGCREERRLTASDRAFIASFNSQEMVGIKGLTRQQVREFLGEPADIIKERFVKPTPNRKWILPRFDEQCLYVDQDVGSRQLVYFNLGVVVFGIKEWPEG